ncbi:MAG: metallophosphoesterase [Sulfurovum sp.]|nr:metallophosphoesterase [Sulfurovum sp.]
MKILIFSDLHAHTFGPYSTALPNGTNSRLQDAVNVIDDVRMAANSLKVDLVLFAGDLFHERRYVVTQAMNLVYTALEELSQEVSLAMIVGNHDQSDRLGRHHALKTMSTFATVLDEAGWYCLGGHGGETISLLAVPYIEDASDLRSAVKLPCPFSPEDTRLFLGHLGVSGAKIGSDFVYTNGAEPTIQDIPTSDFSAGFLGHFHLHQQLASNFWYVGAPMQHNWGDKGQERGIVLYDTSTNESSFLPLEHPQFVEIDSRNLKLRRSDSEKGNFVRVLSPVAWPEEDVEALRVRLGAATLEVKLPKAETEEHKARIEVLPGNSYAEMSQKYVQSDLVDTQDMDEGWLMELANSILAEVSQ